VRRIYFDHNSTTPLDPRALEAMTPYLLEFYGNASSVHSVGQSARAGLEKSREQIAGLLNCRPDELYFTSGATESDNTVVKGVADALAHKGKHIITSKIEHHAILEPCEHLSRHGYDITYLGVDRFGYVDPEELRAAIRDDTILVSVMQANNEVGTIQDIKKLCQIAHDKGVLFHADSVQALGKIPVDIKDLGVDFLSGSAHKFYGPKGCGFLFAKTGARFTPFAHGGSHERNKRAGTENVAAVVGMAKALELAITELGKNQAHISTLAKQLYDGLLQSIPDSHFQGDPEYRIVNTLFVTFPGAEGEATILSLDMKGIAVSSGSACTSGAVEPSHVLLAMGVPPAEAQTAVRFSLGKGNTKDDIEYTLEVLPPIIERLRMMSPIYAQSKPA
jgi:cysteine desulfurase